MILDGLRQPFYLNASDFTTKISVFTRINTTRSSTLTIGEVLEKSGFKLTFIHGKRLFGVFGISLEQVKANFSRTPEPDDAESEKAHEYTVNKKITHDPEIPF